MVPDIQKVLCKLAFIILEYKIGFGGDILSI